MLIPWILIKLPALLPKSKPQGAEGGLGNGSPQRGQHLCLDHFCLPRNSSYLSNLGQLLSISCATILKKKGFSPQIKWPNDILLSGQKVAGILTEAVTFEDRVGIVLGIGLNVNMSKELLKSIDQPATSLAQLGGQTWVVEQILEALLKQFLKDLMFYKAKALRLCCLLMKHFWLIKGSSLPATTACDRSKGSAIRSPRTGGSTSDYPTEASHAFPLARLNLM